MLIKWIRINTKHIIIASLLVIFVIGFFSVPHVFAEDSEIPAWIKNNAGWWATDQIDDSSFLQGIQYLIKEGIMVIPPTETSESSGSEGVPAWVKNNAGWWADGQIDDNTFVSAIQYLIKAGIIVVEQEQTQPTVSEKEIQKLANEISNCDMSVYYGTLAYPVSSNCVLYGDDRESNYINSLPKTWISTYRVICDTNCNLSLYEHYDVENRLEKFHNENQHKQIFDAYISITPKQILDDLAVVTFSVGGNGYGSVTTLNSNAGLAFHLEFGQPRFILCKTEGSELCNYSDGSVSKVTISSVMIHENAHMLGWSSTQSDSDFDDYQVFENPLTEARKILQEKKSSCEPNYFTHSSGCMNDNSYENLFFQKFWAPIYSDHKWFYDFDDLFVPSDNLFYKKYKEQFLKGSYSARNPDEDFAESFTAFVLWEKPIKSTVIDQKILFFYDFPELVEMRDFIRSNL